MSDETYEKGLAIRKAVLGDDYVNASLAKADDFNADFQRLVTEFCWGAGWGREGALSRPRPFGDQAARRRCPIPRRRAASAWRRSAPRPPGTAG
jgi:hypothetical protein